MTCLGNENKKLHDYLVSLSEVSHEKAVSAGENERLWLHTCNFYQKY